MAMAASPYLQVWGWSSTVEVLEDHALIPLIRPSSKQFLMDRQDHSMTIVVTVERTPGSRLIFHVMILSAHPLNQLRLLQSCRRDRRFGGSPSHLEPFKPL